MGGSDDITPQAPAGASYIHAIRYKPCKRLAIHYIGYKPTHLRTIGCRILGIYLINYENLMANAHLTFILTADPWLQTQIRPISIINSLGYTPPLNDVCHATCVFYVVYVRIEMNTIDEINRLIKFELRNGSELPKWLDKQIADEIEALIVRIRARDPKLTEIYRSYIKDDVQVSKLCEALKDNANITTVVLRKTHLSTTSLELIRDNNFIKNLWLLDCNLDDNAAEILSKNKVIENLNLYKNNFTSKGVGYLANCSSKLEVLGLNRCKLDDKSAEILSTSKTIKKMYLKENNITSEGATFFALHNSIIQCLILSYNKISNVAANEFEYNPSIKYLDLSDNIIDENGTDGFSRNPSLYYLNLGGNCIKDKGVLNLSKNPNINILLLGCCGITDKGAEYLGLNTRAAVLDLTWNYIQNKGARFLANNDRILHLILENNFIGSTGAKDFSRNKNMTHLNLKNNSVGSCNGVNELAKNNNFTECSAENTLWPQPFHSTLEQGKFGATALWWLEHFGNSSSFSSRMYLSPKINKNREIANELATHCMNRSIKKVEVWIVEKGARPYGEYFDSRLKTNGTALHLAVLLRDIELLKVLLKYVPKSLLYVRDHVVDGLTYEELAQKTNFHIPSEWKAAYLDKPKSSDQSLSEVAQYFKQIKESLNCAQIAAAGIAAGCQPTLNLLPTLVAAGANTVAPPLGGLIITHSIGRERKKAKSVISWLKGHDDVLQLADHLISVQSENDTALITEDVTTSFGDLLCTLNEEYLQSRDISSATKRAVIHANKLIEFMANERANDNITPTEWRDALLRVVMGSNYNYSPPTPTATRAELEAQVNENKHTLKDQTEELSAVKAKLAIKIKEIGVEKEKVKELEAELSLKNEALAKHQNTITKLENELEDVSLKYQSLDSESQAEKEASANQIEELTDTLKEYKSILNNIYSSCRPSSNASGATNSTLLTDRDRRNGASHLTLATQASNISSHTSASFNAKI